MKGSFINKTTGKVMCSWIEFSDKPLLHSQIFIEGFRADPDKLLDVSRYPSLSWIDDPESLLRQQKIINNKVNSKAKTSGVEYNGVKYSATKDDQDGLVAIYTGIKNDIINSANFEFSNGSILTLNKDNIDGFMSVWTPFRQTFFGA